MSLRCPTAPNPSSASEKTCLQVVSTPRWLRTLAKGRSTHLAVSQMVSTRRWPKRLLRRGIVAFARPKAAVSMRRWRWRRRTHRDLRTPLWLLPVVSTLRWHLRRQMSHKPQRWRRNTEAANRQGRETGRKSCLKQCLSLARRANLARSGRPCRITTQRNKKRKRFPRKSCDQ